MHARKSSHAETDTLSAAITGLILAGGESRRFQSGSKARHPIGGRPMVAHVYDALCAVSGRPPLISIRPGMPRFLSLEAHYVEDDFYDAGPLAGLHAGLRAAETPWLLAVACDMPFLTPAALRRLTTARAPETNAVVAASPDGRRQPLCACYRTRLLPAVREKIDARQLAMHDFIDQLERIKTVRLPQASLRNINERSDLHDVE